MPVAEKTEQHDPDEKIIEIELERLRSFTNHTKAVKLIITWVIPFAFVAYLPARYFLKEGISAFASIGVECILAVVFFVVAYAVFCKGTHAYESAGN